MSENAVENFETIAVAQESVDREAAAARGPVAEAKPLEASEPVVASSKPENPWDDPEAARAEIERLRKENGAARTNAKAKAADEARSELAQTIGKALGLVEDNETSVDPSELTRQIEAEKSSHRATQVELAVYKAAGVAGGDPVALLDSRSFLGTLDDVDPSDVDGVVAAISAAVEANPRLGVEKPSRLPAPNPALGSSAGGAPSLGDQIADAEKRGDRATAIALKAQKLAAIAADQK